MVTSSDVREADTHVPLSVPTGGSRPRAVSGAPRVLRLSALILLLALVAVQMALMVLSSFRPGGLPSNPGFTWSNYASVYGDSQTYKVLLNTGIFGVGSTLFAMVVAFVIVFIIERTDAPWCRGVMALTLAPLAIPSLLLAMAWVLLVSPNIGVANQILNSIGIPFSGSVFSLPGMTLVQGMHMVPLAFMLLLPTVRAINPDFEEAGRTSGASTWRVLRSISIPLAKPALIAIFTFGLIISCVAFDIPAVLGIQARVYTVGSELWLLSDPPSGLPRYGELAAYGIALLVVLLALSIVYQRQSRNSDRYVTVTGKVTAPRKIQLGPWKYVATVIVWLYVLIATIAPLAVLVLGSVIPYFSGLSLSSFLQFTANNYVQLFKGPEVGSAAINTIVVAVVAATAVAAISVLVAWVSSRARGIGSGAIDIMALAPVAMPGVVMGVMLIFTFLTLSFLPIYGTIWIIAIGLGIISIPFGVRMVGGGLIQIDPELEEAGRASGANPIATIRAVTLPLIRPGIVVAWIWTAAFAVRELGLPVMVQSGSNPMWANILWGYWSSGSFNTACAGSVLLCAVLLLGAGAWLGGKRLLQRRKKMRMYMAASGEAIR